MRLMTLLVLTLCGCSVGYQVKIDSTQHGEQKLVVPPPKPAPPFQGAVAKPVEFDLVGEWDLLPYVDQGGHSVDRPWKGKFTLERGKDDEDCFVWGGPNAFGKWELDKHTLKDGQSLWWVTANGAQVVRFSINDHSFGRLMLTGDDKQKYMFLRREGGQDAPPLVYERFAMKVGNETLLSEPIDKAQHLLPPRRANDPSPVKPRGKELSGG